MQFNIRGENIEVTPAIREYVKKKLTKLERYVIETFSTKAHVTLKI